MPDKPGKQSRGPVASSPESDAVTIYRISQEHRTRRIYAILLAVVLIVGIIAVAAVKIAEKPVWEVLIATIGSTLTCILAGQYGFFRLLISRFRRYTRLNQDRVSAIEERHDPNRASSELLPDGTNRPEDIT